MKIVQLEDAGTDQEKDICSGQIVKVDAKRALVGAGARILFYPTLLYNVLRNKMEAEFRWWDEVDQVDWISSFYFTFLLLIFLHSHQLLIQLLLSELKCHPWSCSCLY